MKRKNQSTMLYQDQSAFGPSPLPSPPITPPKWETTSPTSDTPIVARSDDDTNDRAPEPTPQPRKRRAQDPSMSPKEVRRRFLERNRLAAGKCREKRKKEAADLKALAAAKEAKKEENLAQVNSMRNEIAYLKEMMLMHYACGHDNIDQYMRDFARSFPARYAANPFSPQLAPAPPSQASFQAPSEAIFQASQAMMYGPPALPSPALGAHSSNSSLASPAPAGSFDGAFSLESAGAAPAPASFDMARAYNGTTLRFSDLIEPAMVGEGLSADQLPSAVKDSEDLSFHQTTFFEDTFLIDPELNPGDYGVDSW